MQGHQFRTVPIESPCVTFYVYVNNSNLLPMLHHFQDLAYLWSDFCPQQSQGVPLINALMGMNLLHSGWGIDVAIFGELFSRADLGSGTN